MDFLVVGLGLGALAILGGIVMVTLIAWRSARAARRASRPEDQRYHEACGDSRNAAGQALIAAGAVILLATVGAVAGSLDDRTGSLLVATTATVAAIGLVVRDFLYRSRNPLPRRPRAWPLETPVAGSPTRIVPLAVAPVAVALPRDDQEAEIAPDEAVAAVVDEPELDAAPQESLAETGGGEASRVVAEPESTSHDVEADPEEGADGVIDVPYSFMRDDDPAAGTRSAPYSFMVGDEAAAIVAGEPGDDAPDSGASRQARPALRLVGKGRPQSP